MNKRHQRLIMAYSDSERAEAIELLRKSDNNYNYVADLFGCHIRTLRRWRSIYTPDDLKYRTTIQRDLPSKSRWGKRFIYLIREAFRGIIKIGIAKDLSARIGSMQAGCPQELEVLAYIEINNANQHERELHNKYSEKRYRGEWFELSDKDINNILEQFRKWDTENIAMPKKQRQLFD